MDGTAAPALAHNTPLHGQPVPAMFATAVARFAGRPAMEFLGRNWTYRQLGDITARAAAGLQALGVTKGVHVGLCLPNCPYFVIMYHAILQAGGTVVNFNPLYTEREIATQARIADVSIMVSLDLALIHNKIGPLAAAGVFKRVIICRMANALPPVKAAMFRLLKARERGQVPKTDGYTEFSALIAGSGTPATVEIDPQADIAVLQFTGGTTGTPKAAMLSHANLTINVQQSLCSLPNLDYGAERSLAVLPFFHVFAMTTIMNLGLTAGAHLLLVPRLEMKTVMAMIHRLRPTVLAGVPTLFTAISNADEAAGKTDLSFMKFCISGGAPIPAEVMDRFERISHCEILEGYGLSETSPCVAFNFPGAVRRGAVGRALPGTIIEIRDPDEPGRILPAGTRGEICIRGPQVMRAYYNAPEETAQVFVDGALRTGDVGYLDDDGYLYLVDRIKDLIICGGYNVYPRVIEEAAYQHPAVQDAVAIGIADPYRGQAPKLFVTLRAGETATGPEILAFLAAHLNKIEIPKSVEIRDTLPKTLVGKLSKKELIAQEAAK